jgi:exopolysaccharide/PEP-CTERM locus tyrosine autokinase
MSLVERAIARMREATGEKTPAKAPALVPTRSAGDQVATDNTASAKLLTVDLAALRAKSYLPEERMDRQFADYYRQIKRPLIEKALSTRTTDASLDPRIIMMSSALPGDGKTFTSINLALSMARERDLSLLLVDVDLPKPHVSEIFGIQSERGLTDALVDESMRIESLVMNTNIRGFSILPAGRPVEGASELLTSDRMRQLLAELTSNNPRRLILLDSPPLLVTSEARALLKVSGQVVLVVRAGQTPQQAIREAIAMFDERQAGGIVLNQGHLGITEGYYGYGTYGLDRDKIP